MSLWVVTAKHPQTRELTDWFFEDMFDAGKAYALAMEAQGEAKMRRDFHSDFEEFRAWLKGET